MQLMRNLFFAVILSTMLALMLSFLPFNTGEDRSSAPVFQTAKPVMLNRENLVDVLSAFDTKLPISHVKWENDNLFIDYSVNISKAIYVDDIYDSLFSALKSAYTFTNNVQGLYVSVVYKEKGREQVLIALSAERTEKLLSRLGLVEDKKAFLQQNTTLSYGVHWKENIQK